jgi:tyrosinase
MADLGSVQEQAFSLFRRAPLTGAQLLADARIPQDRFSVFKPGHQDRALDLAAEFMQLAGPQPGPDDLEKVLSRASQAFNEHQVEFVKYALMVFITHHPRGWLLPIPSLEMREPEKARQSAVTLGLGARLLDAAPSETDLNWFREDPLANEHHERWHVVYPGRGVPGPGGRHTKKRQGELFQYMHQQMLARYDAERVAIGLDPVAPFDDFNATPGFGYTPVTELLRYYDARPDAAWSDLSDFNYTVAMQQQVGKDLLDAVQNGGFPSTPPGVDGLGASLEATVDGDSQFSPGQSAGLHNMGHVFFAAVGGGPNGGGVMRDTATAIRDPVFFRWHRHIDNVYYAWQMRQTPYDFAADAPPVRIRKSLAGAGSANKSPDIIVCLKENIPGAANPNFDFAQFGTASFGGGNWDKDPATVLPVGELVTQMLDREYDYTDSATGAVFHQKIRYLDQKEFVYFLRLENTSNTQQNVTARIFLVPQKTADQRRTWIEMDKFRCTLAPNAKAVVFRAAWESSVIRKPAKKPPEFLPIRRSGEQAGDVTTYCDCGWPYNLLLPKGSADGMGFRFLVMITDWNKDHVPTGSTCGSLSFCGAKDEYPDDRPMGYPFDCPFPGPSEDIAATAATLDNMATLDVIIRAT